MDNIHLYTFLHPNLLNHKAGVWFGDAVGWDDSIPALKDGMIPSYVWLMGWNHPLFYSMFHLGSLNSGTRQVCSSAFTKNSHFLPPQPTL